MDHGFRTVAASTSDDERSTEPTLRRQCREHGEPSPHLVPAVVVGAVTVADARLVAQDPFLQRPGTAARIGVLAVVSHHPADDLADLLLFPALRGQRRGTLQTTGRWPGPVRRVEKSGRQAPGKYPAGTAASRRGDGCSRDWRRRSPIDPTRRRQRWPNRP